MIFMWIGKCLIFNWNEASPYFCFYMTAVILQKKKKRIFFPGWLILSKYTSDLFFPIYCVVFSWGYIAFWLSPGSTIFIACTQRPFTSCCFGREKWQPKGHFSSPATTLKELNYSAFPKRIKDDSSHQRVWTQLF